MEEQLDPVAIDCLKSELSEVAARPCPAQSRLLLGVVAFTCAVVLFHTVTQGTHLAV